jgi:glycine cleavage system H protein
MATLPDDLLYTRSHEWIKVVSDNGIVGITDHAQKELGEIVYIELPEVGHVFDTDDEFGTVESVKAVSELFVPVAGEVVQVNTQAVEEPGIINDDPFGDGWLIKLKLSTDVGDDLMSAEQYEAYLKEEEAEK